jgi:outer membrane protein assembly factor BamB
LNAPLCRRLTVLAFALGLFAAGARADDWPQWLGPQRDGVWRETGLLDKFPEGGPKVLWRVPVHGGFSGPAVADGRVYLTDYEKTAGDARPNPVVRNKLQGKERVLCLSAADGKLLWKHEYDCPYNVSYPAGPRCTPTVHGGKVYTLGAMGNLACLDAVKGDAVWSRDLKKDYGIPAPMWGFAGHPLVDGNRLICLAGGKGSTVVAFDKDTGKELWKALTAKEPGYSSPVIYEAGGRRQLILWSAEAINGLNPETGEVYWTVPLATYGGMSIMTPRKVGDDLFAGGAFAAAALLKLAKDRPEVKEVWRGKANTALYPINATPFLEDGMIYGADQPGQLRGVKLATGARVWETTAPFGGGKPVSSATAFLVKNGARFFLMSETGDLIIARLSPKAYDEVSRTHLLEPTGEAFGRKVVWSHPAFANRCVFARNDKELVCASLAADK